MLRPYVMWLLTIFLAGSHISPSSASIDTPEEQLAAASALFDAHKWAPAATKLELFLKENPKHAKVGAASFVLGKCRFEQQQYPQAIVAFEKAIATKDPDILLMSEMGLAESAMNAKQYDKASAVLEIATKGGLNRDQSALAWYWLAQSSFQLERYARAEQAYDHVVQSRGKSDLVENSSYGYALSVLKQNRNDPAKQSFKTFLQKYPDSAYRSSVRLFLGQIATEARQFGEAKTEFEGALEVRNGKAIDPEIRSAADDGLIETLLQMQDYRNAATRLEATISRLPATDPQRFRAELSLGHCYYRQKQFEPALTAYTEAAKSNDVNVRAEGYYWCANSDLALNRPAEAGSLFTKAATSYGTPAQASKSLLKAGDAYLSAKQNDSAVAAYRSVMDRYPQSTEAPDAKKALSQLASSITDPVQLLAYAKSVPKDESQKVVIRAVRSFMEQKRFAEAKYTLLDLFKNNAGKPTNVGEGSIPEAHYLMGLILEESHQTPQAVKEMSDAIASQPGAGWVRDAQGRLAWLYLDLKQFPNAEKAATAALSSKLSPKAEEQARLALVQSQLDQSKWTAALEGCQRLLENQPQPETVATVLYTQAWICEKQNMADNALPYWEKLVAEHPKSPFAPTAMMKVGDARFRVNKFTDADSMYKRLATDFPNNSLVPESHFKRGSSLYADSKPAEAAVEFDQCAEAKVVNEFTPEAYYWAGFAYEKAGKKDLAIQRLAKFVSSYPTHPKAANAKVRLAGLRAVS